MSEPSDAGQPRVKGEPAKEFFISMIVRDIGLIPAIIDLVDNSVDGARRLRPSQANRDLTSNRFEGLYIALHLSENEFTITDNCGGIPWDIARNYAFRFGRPPDAPETPGSIGQFGIGMKRALFKLGDNFTVESSTSTERFRLNVNVPEWRESATWDFTDVEHVVESKPEDGAGTTITVRDLKPAASESFVLSRFATELSQELSLRHQPSVSQGLAISLQGIPVDVDILNLLASSQLTPGRATIELDSESPAPVRATMYTGLADSSPTDAGWHIYCNGRLVLGPDRGQTTGWGTSKGAPQYHNQYARFRGYLFFDSTSVEKLPWTTTKDGVDSGHWVYRALKPKMVDAMRPVIAFLNALDAEKDAPPTDRESLESIVATAEASPSPLTQITASTPFSAPRPPVARRAPETQSIQFVRSRAKIEKIKKKLRVSTARQVGEGTFDYFYERECNDDE